MRASISGAVGGKRHFIVPCGVVFFFYCREPLSAAEGETERFTYFAHAGRTKAGHPAPDARLWNSNQVVQIDCAARFHTVFDFENYFRRDASNGGRDRSDRDRGEIANGALASQNQDGPLFVGRSKRDDPNLAARQSSGHEAISSQPWSSSSTWGCAK